ncbi:immunity 22 family protein [Bacillus paralicheniformis]|uniref:immunity 22 family protein n=1 Tax=Bacillus TaxID=1386 RepID=UPI0011A7769C|nr:MULTISPECIES: immunity 22 family protein [Bacillus]MBU8582689.1 immunity 22 family protein [Bacillus paralicheniformis]MBU8681989.1 immunity 22 family protein [Bacillus haynesii]MCY8180718.1 immunity 22 family protein [Bacillus paralicheniformis]MCY8641259.1 immunity 22 family protein [Bacillus haynesii]MEC2209910.1 immunity 22 family protein [Bacillus paralicheniformis]
MERENYVSLWIGSIQTDDKLNEYVELPYDEEEGDFLPSAFLKDFYIDIDDLDEDFIEKVVHDQNKEQLHELIGGCSYDEIILPRFEAIQGKKLPNNINSAILLYNFDYEGKRNEIVNDGYTFKFIGSVSYV